MTTQPYAILLIGSAKPPGQSTSESFGSYLCDQLESYGWKTQTEYAASAFDTMRDTTAFLRNIDEADLLILASPVYVDALPYPVTLAMEQIYNHRRAFDASAIVATHFAAIINSGKPEAQHTDVAMEICQQFAIQAKFDWSGGLRYGGGGRIDGRDVQVLGPRASYLTEALDMAADALAVGSFIPEEADRLMSRSVSPVRVYRIITRLKWRYTAWRQGALGRMTDRPLTQEGKSG